MIQTTKDEIIYHFTVTLKTNASKHQKKTMWGFYMFVCICHKSFLMLIIVNMYSRVNIQSVSSAKCADDNLVPCTALCASEEDRPDTEKISPYITVYYTCSIKCHHTLDLSRFFLAAVSTGPDRLLYVLTELKNIKKSVIQPGDKNVI